MMARILSLFVVAFITLHLSPAEAASSASSNKSKKPAAKPAASSAKKTAAKTTATSSKTRTTSAKAKSTTRKPAPPSAKKLTSSAKVRTASTKSSSATVKKTASRSSRTKRRSYSPWSSPNYAESTDGDNIDGDDIVVRRAAVEALGPYNGTVVVADPNTGRVLTIVNQKVAYKSGFQPCSTIKVVIGMAGLVEGIIENDTPMRLTRSTSMNLTQALAKSNNPYFANLGSKMGFERVSYYARLFGLGERATIGLDEEQPGRLPPTPPANGGVGMMSSFGEGITLTPLQLTAMLSAISNGGTLYYLQYPKTPQEAENFVPRIKRQLDIAPWIPEIKPGMMGAVEYGTAKRAGYSPDEPILGKTGTCTDRATPTHLGWFGSFNDVDNNRLVVTVLLTGGSRVNGPVASGIAGDVYKNLSEQRYFASKRQTSPIGLVNGQSCCLR